MFVSCSISYASSDFLLALSERLKNYDDKETTIGDIVSALVSQVQSVAAWCLFSGSPVEHNLHCTIFCYISLSALSLLMLLQLCSLRSMGSGCPPATCITLHPMQTLQLFLLGRDQHSQCSNFVCFCVWYSRHINYFCTKIIVLGTRRVRRYTSRLKHANQWQNAFKNVLHIRPFSLALPCKLTCWLPSKDWHDIHSWSRISWSVGA